MSSFMSKRILLATIILVLFTSLFALEKPLALLLNNPDYGNNLSPLEDFLKKNEIPYELYKTFKDEFPEIDSYSALIVGGGSSFLNYFDENNEELTGTELIKNTKKPVLGICLGCQIIGKAYEVELKFDEERKWNVLDAVSYTHLTLPTILRV